VACSDRRARRSPEPLAVTAPAGVEEGAARTCRRAFAPVGIEQTAILPQQRWAPSQARTGMKLVWRTEPQLESRCHMVSRTVMRSETSWTQQYDSISKSSRSVMQTRMVPHQELQQECLMETVWRSVSRLEPVTEWVQPPPELARWVDGMLYQDEARSN
jgi:hypothetical protein